MTHDQDIQEYIDSLPPARRAIVGAIHTLLAEALPELAQRTVTLGTEGSFGL